MPAPSRSPIRPLLLFTLLSGLFMLAAATNARAADEPREGYERVPAQVITEKAYSADPRYGGCAVGRFLVWKKLANEDREKTFFGHWLWRGEERSAGMGSPFRDNGNDPVWAWSSAPADSHKWALGAGSAPHPDPNERRDEDCDEMIENTESYFDAHPSQIYVDVPVTEKTECTDARSKLKKVKRKVKQLKRKVRRLEGRSGPRAERKLKRTKRKRAAARQQVKALC